MRSKALWRWMSAAIACSFVAACGGSGSGSDSGASSPTSVNNAPQITGAPSAVAQVDTLYTFTPSASDADGDTLTFQIENRPEWATFSPSTGRLEGTPPSTAQAVYQRVLISVTDGKAFSELPAFDLTVQGIAPTNTAPTISGTPAASVVAGNAYDFVPQVSDPDGQTLAFSVTGLPSWADFDDVTGHLSGTPGASDVGTFGGIVISVSDGVDEVTLPAFSIAVTGGTAPGPTNQAPTISGAPTATVAAGQAYSFRPTAADPDGQALTFSIANGPAWANFNTSTGRLSGTPTAASVGSYPGIVISVSDGAATTALPAFSITVVAANNAPTIGGTPATSVRAGQAYSFTPTASDADGQALTFSIVNRPSWATFSASTGQLSGTPTAANIGTYSNVTIRVTDGIAQVSLAPFTLVVQAANRAPVISGTPTSSATVGQAYSFTPTASDPDGQTLTFSIANRPSWATFSSTTGRLSGTPTAANVGSYTGIVISVSDGTANTSLPSFSLNVSAAANRSPVISGTPGASATVGQPYSFTPTASDPDGQALTFSIANRPSWANFNPSTGRLSGTPAAADAGSYAGIVISVTDGTATVSLPSFTLTVQQIQTGSATIRWTPPTSNTDNSPLTNLRGYRIYYGTSSTNLNQVFEIANAGVTSGVVENLAPGTWYFAVKAYNTSNVESDLSNVTSKAI